MEREGEGEMGRKTAREGAEERRRERERGRDRKRERERERGERERVREEMLDERTMWLDVERMSGTLTATIDLSAWKNMDFNLICRSH